MAVTIRIDTDNAAFADGNESREVARILRVLAERLEKELATADRRPLYDENGNKVGLYLKT